MDTPWTPGPWRVSEPHGGFSQIEQETTGEFIFGLAAGSSDEKQPDHVCEANARVIEAAPQLAEALHNLVPEAEAVANALSSRGQGFTLLGMRALAAKRALRAAGHPEYQEK